MACGKMTIDGKTWLVVGPWYGSQKQNIGLLDPLNVNQGWIKSGQSIRCVLLSLMGNIKISTYSQYFIQTDEYYV